jgi:hypothetical protein
MKALNVIAVSKAEIMVNQNKLSSVECFDQPEMKQFVAISGSFLITLIVLLFWG